jgi:antagonist of KipI
LERTGVFKVIEPGILTTVQDLGRHGFRRYGVPPSGALDSFSLRIGNLLVGNGEGETGLEITLSGLALKALKEVVVAVTGGDLSPALNGEPLEMWRTHILVEGDCLAFKKVRSGCRAYLAIPGGIDVPPVMDSRATYLSGKFGGLEGRALKKGDILFTSSAPSTLDKLGCRFSAGWVPRFEKEALLRLVWGPQDFHFTEQGLETLSTKDFRVTPRCDRVGLRLDGPRIERRDDVEESIISEGLMPGVIQVPGDGKPMIILADTVSGGYTKIATVISADLFRVAQLKPGDHVRFHPISIEEAHRLLREQEERIQIFKESLDAR